jgi:hypothetical protein
LQVSFLEHSQERLTKLNISIRFSRSFKSIYGRKENTILIIIPILIITRIHTGGMIHGGDRGGLGGDIIRVTGGKCEGLQAGNYAADLTHLNS